MRGRETARLASWHALDFGRMDAVIDERVVE
jgi:hypothetical protein